MCVAPQRPARVRATAQLISPVVPDYGQFRSAPFIALRERVRRQLARDTHRPHKVKVRMGSHSLSTMSTPVFHSREGTAFCTSPRLVLQPTNLYDTALRPGPAATYSFRAFRLARRFARLSTLRSASPTHTIEALAPHATPACAPFAPVSAPSSLATAPSPPGRCVPWRTRSGWRGGGAQAAGAGLRVITPVAPVSTDGAGYGDVVSLVWGIVRCKSTSAARVGNEELPITATGRGATDLVHVKARHPQCVMFSGWHMNPISTLPHGVRCSARHHDVIPHIPVWRF